MQWLLTRMLFAYIQVGVQLSWEVINWLVAGSKELISKFSYTDIHGPTQNTNSVYFNGNVQVLNPLVWESVH